MAKPILFAVKAGTTNTAVNQNIMSKLDCFFEEFNARKIQSVINNKEASLIVLFLSGLSTDDEIELQKLLIHVPEGPYVLAGKRDELHRFYKKSNANIVKYIKTPMRLGDYIEEIKSTYNRVNGIKTETAPVETKDEIVEKRELKHILIVDDDIISLRTISNVLNGLFKVSVVKSGAGAISFLTKEKPDLILLDYMMPVCDGLQTLQMIREDESNKDIPVFFLTGVADPSLVEKAISLKPQGYILKSAGDQHLISKIEAYF